MEIQSRSALLALLAVACSSPVIDDWSPTVELQDSDWVGSYAATMIDGHRLPYEWQSDSLALTVRCADLDIQPGHSWHVRIAFTGSRILGTWQNGGWTEEDGRFQLWGWWEDGWISPSYGDPRGEESSPDDPVRISLEFSLPTGHYSGIFAFERSATLGCTPIGY